ncbi:MAG: dihydroorotase [Nitrospirae bacterium]|nr:MAG: dihydroorotase [Nitrospirota bacterium]
MAGLLLKNCWIVDPSQNLNTKGDILIERGKIKSLGRARTSGSVKTFDAKGCLVIPGVVDIHTHLREPGQEHKETIRTATEAALSGGVTSVCCMANTSPVNDNPTVTRYILQKASLEARVDVYPIGAVTKGLQGKELAELGLMVEAGCVAFSDDGHPIMDSMVMKRALEYLKRFDRVLISHCEDKSLSAGGTMNEGPVSYKLGLRGIPSEAEVIMIKRDIELASLTGGKLHIAHVSTRGGVEAIRQAKKAGIPVTAETCPHYFLLTDEAVEDYNTMAKVNPPLRSKKDLEAIIEGLSDGTIDVIASDHAPHHRDEKLCEFDRAAFGISGVETLLLLSLELYHKKVLSIEELARKLTINPANVVGIPKGTLKTGAQADLVVVDLNSRTTIDASRFLSLGKNTPFHNWTVNSRIVARVFKGKLYQ